MNFNSFEYLIFFPTAIIIYYALPHKFRWIFLLAASYVFYMFWNPFYIVLILLSTVVDYCASIWMAKKNTKKEKRKFLYLSLLVNLGLLLVFKYFNFFSSTVGSSASLLGIGFTPPILKLLLPIGISFYTFQTLSYTIDVYRGKREPERHFGYFALFVTFFPQLVAGPIERSDVLLPQLREKHVIEYDRFASGLRRMAWGFFKKIVIADRLAIVVNQVYNAPAQSNGIQVIVATVLFSYQVYCDFSGYSDIAIGSARIMGVDLIENFKRPFFSRSFSEFWKRWHISIMKWFQDYVYYPVLLRKKEKITPRKIKSRTYQSIMAVFIVSGFWHGAAWHYVIFGVLHGLIVVTESIIKPYMDRFVKRIGLTKRKTLHMLLDIFVFFVIYNIVVVFFRAGSVSDAMLVFKTAVTDIPQYLSLGYLINSILAVGGKFNWLCILIGLFILGLVEILQSKYDITRDILHKMPNPVRKVIYGLFVAYILLFGVFGAEAFIYFQF